MRDSATRPILTRLRTSTFACCGPPTSWSGDRAGVGLAGAGGSRRRPLMLAGWIATRLRFRASSSRHAILTAWRRRAAVASRKSFASRDRAPVGPDRRRGDRRQGRSDRIVGCCIEACGGRCLARRAGYAGRRRAVRSSRAGRRGRITRRGGVERWPRSPEWSWGRTSRSRTSTRDARRVRRVPIKSQLRHEEPSDHRAAHAAEPRSSAVSSSRSAAGRCGRCSPARFASSARGTRRATARTCSLVRRPDGRRFEADVLMHSSRPRTRVRTHVRRPGAGVPIAFSYWFARRSTMFSYRLAFDRKGRTPRFSPGVPDVPRRVRDGCRGGTAADRVRP